MSQNAFVARFGILPSTLRDWEQNRPHPDKAARALRSQVDRNLRRLGALDRYAQRSSSGLRENREG